MDDEAVHDRIWHRGLGDNTRLGEWTERAVEAVWLMRELPLKDGDRLVDLGCGKQTLRSLIPPELSYVPVDIRRRSDDTLVMDLNLPVPDGHFEVAAMLGLLEYLRDPLARIDWCAEHADYCVFSYADCSDEQRNRRQHWIGCVGFEAVERRIAALGGRILRCAPQDGGLRLYSVEFNGHRNDPAGGSDRDRGQAANTDSQPRIDVPSPRPDQPPRPVAKTLALFSPAVHCVNAGNAMIVDAVRRLLGQHEHKVFPLLDPLTEEQIEQVNACDMGVICGTNLYQNVFRCALTVEALNRFRIPILPLGIGAGAPIGEMPRMKPEGVETVRMLHQRCAVSSVRDPAGLEFLRSIGIRNAELTGCPVLFHAGRAPRFGRGPGGKLHVSIRAYLLKVDRSLVEREARTLDAICRRFEPVLVVQGPEDLGLAFDLVKKYSLDCVFDKEWSHEPFVEAVRRSSRTVGYRLHFGMLGLSHGIPASFMGTDTRISSFCDMMGLRYHDIHTYRDEDVLEELEADPPEMGGFVSNWKALHSAMEAVLQANGLLAR
jgi:polysaccharide pyruvyl transferase WcaK-like protein